MYATMNLTVETRTQNLLTTVSKIVWPKIINTRVVHVHTYDTKAPVRSTQAYISYTYPWSFVDSVKYVQTYC